MYIHNFSLLFILSSVRSCCNSLFLHIEQCICKVLPVILKCKTHELVSMSQKRFSCFSSSIFLSLHTSLSLLTSLYLYFHISSRSHPLSLYFCIFTICSSSWNKTKIFGKRTLPWYMCIWFITLTRLSSLQNRVLQQFILRVWQLV